VYGNRTNKIPIVHTPVFGDGTTKRIIRRTLVSRVLRAEYGDGQKEERCPGFLHVRSVRHPRQLLERRINYR